MPGYQKTHKSQPQQKSDKADKPERPSKARFLTEQLFEAPETLRPEQVLAAHQQFGNQVVQRALDNNRPSYDPVDQQGNLREDLSRQIQQKRGGGKPLLALLEKDASQKLGHRFDDVRIHTDETADQLSRSIHARAFTIGKDIFFKNGAFAPSSVAGRKTLLHELTHVVQQGGRGAVGALKLGKPDTVHEQEAQRIGSQNTSIHKVSQTAPTNVVHASLDDIIKGLSGLFSTVTGGVSMASGGMGAASAIKKDATPTEGADAARTAVGGAVDTASGMTKALGALHVGEAAAATPAFGLASSVVGAASSAIKTGTEAAKAHTMHRTKAELDATAANKKAPLSERDSAREYGEIAGRAATSHTRGAVGAGLTAVGNTALAVSAIPAAAPIAFPLGMTLTTIPSVATKAQGVGDVVKERKLVNQYLPDSPAPGFPQTIKDMLPEWLGVNTLKKDRESARAAMSMERMKEIASGQLTSKLEAYQRRTSVGGTTRTDASRLWEPTASRYDASTILDGIKRHDRMAIKVATDSGILDETGRINMPKGPVSPWDISTFEQEDEFRTFASSRL